MENINSVAIVTALIIFLCAFSVGWLKSKLKKLESPTFPDEKLFTESQLRAYSKEQRVICASKVPVFPREEMDILMNQVLNAPDPELFDPSFYQPGIPDWRKPTLEELKSIEQ